MGIIYRLARIGPLLWRDRYTVTLYLEREVLLYMSSQASFWLFASAFFPIERVYYKPRSKDPCLLEAKWLSDLRFIRLSIYCPAGCWVRVNVSRSCQTVHVWPWGIFLSRCILFLMPFTTIRRYEDCISGSRMRRLTEGEREGKKKGRRREKKRGRTRLHQPKRSPQSSTFDQTLIYCLLIYFFHLFYLFYLSHSCFLSSYTSSPQIHPPH